MNPALKPLEQAVWLDLLGEASLQVDRPGRYPGQLVRAGKAAMKTPIPVGRLEPCNPWVQLAQLAAAFGGQASASAAAERLADIVGRVRAILQPAPERRVRADIDG